MKTRLKILAALVSLGWFFWIVYVVAFHEGLTLFVGVLTTLFLLATFSRLQSTWLRIGLSTFLAACCLVGGVLSIMMSHHIQNTKNDFTKGLLQKTGEALLQYKETKGSFPECPWVCMTGELETAGVWAGTFEIQAGDQVEVAYEKHLPQRDPWGCRFVYVLRNSNRFELSSSGADRRFGTGDDILLPFETDSILRNSLEDAPG